MTERVVDELEMVEIEHDQRAAALFRAAQPSLDAVREGAAVGEPGHAVVVGQDLKLGGDVFRLGVGDAKGLGQGSGGMLGAAALAEVALGDQRAAGQHQGQERGNEAEEDVLVVADAEAANDCRSETGKGESDGCRRMGRSQGDRTGGQSAQDEQ